MEQLAARARIDLFVEVFGRELIIRAVGVDAELAPARSHAVPQPGTLLAGVQRARPRGVGRPLKSTSRAREVRGDHCIESGRVLHGSRCGPQRVGRRGPFAAGSLRHDTAGATPRCRCARALVRRRICTVTIRDPAARAGRGDPACGGRGCCAAIARRRSRPSSVTRCSRR